MNRAIPITERPAHLACSLAMYTVATQLETLEGVSTQCMPLYYSPRIHCKKNLTGIWLLQLVTPVASYVLFSKWIKVHIPKRYKCMTNIMMMTMTFCSLTSIFSCCLGYGYAIAIIGMKIVTFDKYIWEYSTCINSACVYMSEGVSTQSHLLQHMH